MKQYGFIQKWPSVNCKCILQTLKQPLKTVKKKSLNDTPRKERKWNYIKYLGKNTKDRKTEKTKIGTMNKGSKQKTITNMIGINPMISIITLNIYGLNSPIGRQ